ncbi:ABC transporter substrate-binding protein [Bartonella sp. LJL80]
MAWELLAKNVYSRRNVLAGVLCANLLMLSHLAKAATSDSKKAIIDIAGRKVEITGPIRRILLGDGPIAYVMALLVPENPFAKVIGWGDNFRAADLDGFRAYARKYSQIEKIPAFSSGTSVAIDSEFAIWLQPDIVIMNLSSRASAQASGLLDRLDDVGIPVIFIDFRTDMFGNTTRSILILGELLDQQQRAAAFIQFRQEQIEKVLEPLSKVSSRPTVMIERAAGLYDDCCLTYGNGNFGEMIRVAGGDNIGSQFIAGIFGTLNPEQVIAADPDIVLVTGANWSLYSPIGDWVKLGPGSDQKEALSRLSRLMQRPAYRTLRAVREHKVYAIWHPFYDNPYYFIALQQIAKWLHPELFISLDPEKTFQDLHQRFLPIPYQSGYWVSMDSST